MSPIILINHTYSIESMKLLFSFIFNSSTASNNSKKLWYIFFLNSPLIPLTSACASPNSILSISISLCNYPLRVFNVHRLYLESSSSYRIKNSINQIVLIVMAILLPPSSVLFSSYYFPIISLQRDCVLFWKYLKYHEFRLKQFRPNR
jgi:hypothetical protein